MNLLTRPATTHLLSASLGSLHEESSRWLEEIDFWQSEMAFLYKLLNKRMPTKTFPSENLSTMEKELVDIQTSVLGKTKREIIKHEKGLAALLQNPLMSDDEAFRDGHQKILMRMYAISDVIKSFKGEVMALF